MIFVYDVTNLQSFEKLTIWMAKIKNIFESEPKKPIMALFGNKSDLEHQRAVRLSCVQKFAAGNFLETFKGSARTGEMVIILLTLHVIHIQGVEWWVDTLISTDRKQHDGSENIKMCKVKCVYKAYINPSITLYRSFSNKMHQSYTKARVTGTETKLFL